MDPMIIGATVPFISGTLFDLYSAWMPRHGNAVRLAVEVFTAENVKLTVQSKNREDTEADVVDLGNAMSTGTVSVRVTGAKELVRYKVTTNPGQELWNATDLLRLLDPQWER